MKKTVTSLVKTIIGTGFLSMFFWHLLVILLGITPEVAYSQFGNIETDARTMPWSSITRLALEGGIFPPAFRPVSENEIASLLCEVQQKICSKNAPAFSDRSEYARLFFLLDQYRNNDIGLFCNDLPRKNDPTHFRVSGRMIGGYSGMGNPVPFEGGHSFAAGHNIFFEPSVEFAAGSFWSALNFRFGGRTVSGGVQFDGPDGNSSPLTWPRWSIPTGQQEVRNARLKGGAWSGQVTRALVGTQWGNWAFSAGWDHQRSGPGLTGSLNLDYQGNAFPTLTVRRTNSFQWNGIMTHVAPDYFLLRSGLLSERIVKWGDIYGRHEKEANPYFFQWLLGWNVTSWFRTNFTHTVMATAREGTLWPDIFQINFPLIGTTWREMDSGPITDRIFAVQFEFRWRDAPWPILPASAGRLFWDYGGTDFLPSGPGGMIPQISIPASVVGFELLSPRWDMGFEYAELQHTKVLWYSNGGYSEGYSQEGTLLAHPLGGSGESLTALVRVRPSNWGVQAELQGQWAAWGMKWHTPGIGEAHSLAMSFSRTPRAKHQNTPNSSSPLLWEITAMWNREMADPNYYQNPPTSVLVEEKDWWSIIFKISI